MIALLEDNTRRLQGFRQAVRSRWPLLEIVHWRSARDMIRECGLLLPRATLISLDHDLEVLPGFEDPGDGLDVARYLVTCPVCLPVIVHSSNADRATQMVGEFELAGWPVSRVLPLGPNWIEEDWCVEVARILGRAKSS